MMQEHYCGNWYNCDADILDFLTESGVRVMWKVNDERWKVLSSEDEIKRVLRPSTSPYKEEPNVWVSYRIPSERYPLLKAQLRQKQREEDAEIDARMRAEYEADQRRKLEAYLKKYPWAENPEGWQEGIDWEKVNDPVKGEVIVDLRDKRRK